MTRINEKLGSWLIKTDHTKTEVANALGVSLQTLNNKIEGNTPWLFTEVGVLVELLGCTYEDLA